MKEHLIQFWNDEEGATAVEYALIAGLMAVAIIAAIGSFSGGLQTLFEELADKIHGTPAAPEN